jgi:hypothetical protein
MVQDAQNYTQHLLGIMKRNPSLDFTGVLGKFGYWKNRVLDIDALRKYDRLTDQQKADIEEFAETYKSMRPAVEKALNFGEGEGDTEQRKATESVANLYKLITPRGIAIRDLETLNKNLQMMQENNPAYRASMVWSNVPPGGMPAAPSVQDAGAAALQESLQNVPEPPGEAPGDVTPVTVSP